MNPVLAASRWWRRFVVAAATALGPMIASDDPAAQWPRFRGPNGSGLATGDIPAEWTESDRRWKIRLPGVGHGSPVVWGNRVFLLCGRGTEGERIPMCVDATSGRVLWQSAQAVAYEVGHKFNSPASTTPAVDADCVYFSWSSPENVFVTAFTHDGTPVWTADLGPIHRTHGFGSSPILHDDLVILSNDQEKHSAVFALDRRTGKVRWKLPREENHSNYSTPCLYTPPGGRPQVVVSSWRLGVTGIDADTGRQLWQTTVFDQKRSERAVGSPIAAGDLVIANCAFVNGPKHVVALRPHAELGMKEVWRVEKTVPHIPSVIAVDGRAYLWSDQGIVSCVALDDGRVIWQERASRDTFGSPVAVNGSLFCVDKEGTVTVLALGDTFRLLARNELSELCQSTPAVAGGRMFIRTWEHLHAIDGRKSLSRKP
jgi:outer membrane protein assembly factor BamB